MISITPFSLLPIPCTLLHTPHRNFTETSLLVYDRESRARVFSPRDEGRQCDDASASVRWSTEAAHCPEQYVLRWAECAWAHRDRDEAVTRRTTFIKGEVNTCYKQ